MLFNIDKVVGIHGDALAVRARRTELLAQNLANADTPNYKARDIDFRSVLNATSHTQTTLKPTSTRGNHIKPNNFSFIDNAMYRVPLQPSQDGNTVNTEYEQTEFLQNALRYQATLNFIDGNVKSMRKALTEG